MVAFQGTGPAMNALVTGKVDYMCDQVVSVVPRARAGSIRVYAVATSGRNPSLPDVPTAREAGVPAFQVSAWNGLFAPAGTPKPIIASLNAALGKALDDKAVRATLLDLGSDIADGDMRSPEALGRLVTSEIAKWTPIIAQVNRAE